MSNRKLTPQELTPLRPDRDTSEPEAWSPVTPRARESYRWQSSDGRWVALAVGAGDDLGRVVVTDWSGRRKVVDDYEYALALAKSWWV